MKKFISKICLFFLLIVIIDIVFGFAMGKISKRIDIGGTGRDNYICNKATDEVLVFGSSRAEYHYNTQMLTDSLGISCYNCGQSGNGIILAYGRLLMMLERYKPKTIIYEVTPAFDFHDEKDNHKGLGILKRYYNRPGVDSIFLSIDPMERYKMMSGMYRYNSSFLQNLIVYLTKKSTQTGVRGFRALDGEMDTMKIRKNHIAYDSKEGYVYDSLKIQYFNKFLDKTKGIKLVFVVSPVWYGQDTLVLEPIKEIGKKRNVQLVDFSNDPKYVHNNEYFFDGMHMNARGADEFTRDIIKYLKQCTN